LRSLIKSVPWSSDACKAVDDTETALYAAADRGHQAVVRALIEAGANVNKAREGGWTPIYVAA